MKVYDYESRAMPFRKGNSTSVLHNGVRMLRETHEMLRSEPAGKETKP